MKKNNKRNYIIAIIILAFIIVLKLIFNTSPEISYNASLFFWLILAIITYLTCGMPKTKHYLNKISTKHMVIYLLSYLLIIYLLGIFTGFLTSTYNTHNFIQIIKNILPVLFLILSKETVRYITCKNGNKKILIIITILYTTFDILLKNYNYNLSNGLQIFYFISSVLIPTIAKESLCTYITSQISLIPTLIYIISFEIAGFVLPIYPDLGNFLTSVIGLLFPYIIYRGISKLVNYTKKEDLKNKKIYLLPLIPIIIATIIIIILTSGTFSYKMIAIGSDSMNPVYYMGDAVIYKKTPINKIKKDDILVFENNKTIITHRVINIIEKDNTIYFQTKGDNNDKPDDQLISEYNVQGTVKYIVKYIGYPTIWLQNTFN